MTNSPSTTDAPPRPWSYEIQYGPNGEEIYAWVYYLNFMVCTVKVHHAAMIVEAVNNHEALKARLAEVEKDRDRARDCHEETAQKLHSYIHLRAAASRPATQQTTSKLGAWLAAALDDPNVCAEMKADIEAWMNAGEPAYDHATQVVDREAVAQAICKSGKFETGQGTCAVLCMDQLGDVRKKGCGHCSRVHGKLADAILSLLRTALAAVVMDEKR